MQMPNRQRGRSGLALLEIHARREGYWGCLYQVRAASYAALLGADQQRDLRVWGAGWIGKPMSWDRRCSGPSICQGYFTNNFARNWELPRRLATGSENARSREGGRRRRSSRMPICNEWDMMKVCQESYRSK